MHAGFVLEFCGDKIIAAMELRNNAVARPGTCFCGRKPKKKKEKRKKEKKKKEKREKREKKKEKKERPSSPRIRTLSPTVLLNGPEQI